MPAVGGPGTLGGDGGASDTGDSNGDGGAPASSTGGDMAPSAPPVALPMLPSGNYSATSSGLLANTCTAPPDNADLGIWSLMVVSPSVWNITMAQGLSPAVLNLAGALFVGQTFETGMPIYGCNLRQTYKLQLTPTSTSQAQGQLDTVFDVLSGDCSMYEPVLPCTQSYAVTLNKAN